MAGVLLRDGFAVVALIALTIMSHLAGLAEHPVMRRRPWPMSAALGLFLAWSTE